MRERIEDLGRLMVMIDDILQMQLFNELANRKFHKEEFYKPIEDYMIETVQERLYDCLEICKGQDYLNEKD